MILVKFAFNALFLGIIWTMVYFMYKRKKLVCYKERLTVRSILAGFSILALGTTLYAIFNILAYIMGSAGPGVAFEKAAGVMNLLTITLFLLTMLFAFKYHFGKGFDFSLLILMGLGVLRLVTVIFMYQEMKILGNIFLILLGLGVILLMLKESFEKGDHIFAKIGILLLLYIICSIPMLFFLENENLNMLLILPKVLAILAIALISIKELFNKPGLNFFKF